MYLNKYRIKDQLDKVVGYHSDALLFVTIDRCKQFANRAKAAQLAQIPTEAIIWFYL